MSTYDIPSARPLHELDRDQRRVMTGQELREHGVPPAVAAARCRPGGPWQMLLPGVFLLRSGPPTRAERLQAALRWTGGRPGEAMLTGLAALELHGFAAHRLGRQPAAGAEVAVLVPRTRRLRSTDRVRVVRAHELPQPVDVGGFPVAPVARAVADALDGAAEPAAAGRLLTESVRGGHCEPHTVVLELSRARLLTHPHVVAAIDGLLAEGRAVAEGRLRELVRVGGLPDPWWNVELRLPDGAPLGGVDAYWPEQAVAVELDVRVPRQAGTWPPGAPGADEEARWTACARRREALEAAGITLLHLTPTKLRESLDQQTLVVRTALLTATVTRPAPRVVVLPR